MKKDIILSVSKDLGISPDVVEKVYKAYWLYIKTTIEALPLKEDLTEEEFSKLRTNFNIPSLGKLSCTLDKYKGTIPKANINETVPAPNDRAIKAITIILFSTKKAACSSLPICKKIFSYNSR